MGKMAAVAHIKNLFNTCELHLRYTGVCAKAIRFRHVLRTEERSAGIDFSLLIAGKFELAKIL
jgi:hypothetical protein